MAQANYPAVSCIGEDQRTMVPGIVESKRLLQLLAGWGKLSAKVKVESSRTVGHQEESWVAYTLGQTQMLFRQLTGRLHLPAHTIKRSEAKQRSGELRRLSDLLTELPRAGVGLSYLWRSQALDGLQRHTHSEL